MVSLSSRSSQFLLSLCDKLFGVNEILDNKIKETRHRLTPTPLLPRSTKKSLIQKYTLNHMTDPIRNVKVYSLIKGYWRVWLRRARIWAHVFGFKVLDVVLLRYDVGRV